jgi:hypothetical protein
MAARAKVLVANQSFTAEVKGERVHVHGGERVASNHPAVKGRESFFEEAKDVDHETPRGRRKP